MELNGFYRPNDISLNVVIPKKSDFGKIKNSEIKEIYIPISIDLKKDKIISRFLAKVGVEVIAQRFWNSAKDICK